MTVTTASFRGIFPEFASTATYPEPVVSFWLATAAQFVNPARWGDSTDLGISLWLAHQLVVAGKNAAAVQAGGSPGQSAGVLTSKSAGGVSAGYDFSSVAEENAGFWNESTYGRQYFRLARLFGAGPLQIGTDGGYFPSTSGWPGPTF